MRRWTLAAQFLREGLDPHSKLATIVAVVIAGIWTYHLHQITGEGDINPEVWVSSQTFPYSKDARLLIVRIREKNVGKVEMLLAEDALSLKVKQIPEGLAPGYVDMDKQPVAYEVKNLFSRYRGGVTLSAGTEFEDVTQFVVTPGLYHVEAYLALPDGDSVNDIAVARVE